MKRDLCRLAAAFVVVYGLLSIAWFFSPSSNKAQADQQAVGKYQIHAFYSPAFSPVEIDWLEHEMNEWLSDHAGIEFRSLSSYHGPYDSAMLTLTYRTGTGENPYHAKLFVCKDIGSSTARPTFERELNDWLVENSGVHWINAGECQHGNTTALFVIVYQQ